MLDLIHRSLHARRLENQARAENIQLHRAVVGSVKRPFMWRDLCARIRGVLKMDASQIQPEFAASMKMADDGKSFILDRARYPKARVHAVLQADLLIEVHCSLQKTDNAPLTEWEYLVEMPVDELDRVSFQYHGEIVSQDDIALLILAPVRDPAFKPPNGS